MVYPQRPHRCPFYILTIVDYTPFIFLSIIKGSFEVQTPLYGKYGREANSSMRVGKERESGSEESREVMRVGR